MTAQALPKWTQQDYLAYERRNEAKHEFVNGMLFAMAGASRWHNLIVTNVSRELSLQLKGKTCEVYPNDMRVHIPDTGLYTYSDAVVVCGVPRFEDAIRDTLLNPTVVIEVLSPSTEGYDRGAKFRHYRRIESLRHYVLITQDQPYIECYSKQEGSPFWFLTEADGLEAEMSLPAIDCVLQLAETYDKVVFDETERQEFMDAARRVPR
ncbi:hypothetical protein U14_05653 [Candidatus Moduliflexus flocculans]|uniref:Putative restriction endonuclease domain-containing protein n=1 Tax=Candidatus Moduliflexus flocculans TaxID=1499966 RepID=A0A081BSI7_9BACT|nr:hypothetical protein U14_05653 [Candidatus Moduliflexus flocculans]